MSATTTQPAPTKQRLKVEHIVDAGAAREARRVGFGKVPSICGMKLLPLSPAYKIVKRDTVTTARTETRVCKKCLAVLGKWQREEDKQITRAMERQFKEASRD